MPAAIPSTPKNSASAPRRPPRRRGYAHAARPSSGERHEAAGEVVAGRGARLRLDEVVVEHVQRDQGDRDQEEEGLATPAAPPRERRGGGVADRVRVAVIGVSVYS